MWPFKRKENKPATLADIIENKNADGSIYYRIVFDDRRIFYSFNAGARTGLYMLEQEKFGNTIQAENALTEALQVAQNLSYAQHVKSISVDLEKD